VSAEDGSGGVTGVISCRIVPAFGIAGTTGAAAAASGEEASSRAARSAFGALGDGLSMRMIFRNSSKTPGMTVH
jgi:hypothetical protein